jgi:hypothetical protein
MYREGEEVRTARGRGESPPGPTPAAAARLALARVRKLLDAYVGGMVCDGPRLQAALALPFAEAELEAQRHFALGWLAWLDGKAAAESLLAEAARRARELGGTAAHAEAAYWCTRVGLRQGRAAALAEYEATLRTLGGSPQATAWFVDLLWRAGRVDRAEQVWKSVRGNRKVGDCPEGPLLEARVLLRRGELAGAERALKETLPTQGVVWVERHLLLAWAAFSGKQAERGRALLGEARAGPYPAEALAAWALLCERRAAGQEVGPAEVGAPPALEEYLRGQEARLAGDTDVAAAAYRAALASPAVQPFARFGLACLGQDDPAAVLAAQPGLFLALRCRARVALERFRRRQATPAEFLEALQQASAAGYRHGAAAHFRRLALALSERQPTADMLRQLASEEGPGAADRLRAALEVAVRRLPPPASVSLLLEWAGEGGPADALGLGPTVGQHLLRLLLLGASSSPLPRFGGEGGKTAPSPPTLSARGEGLKEAVCRLLPGEPLLRLAGVECQPDVTNTPAPPAVRLLELAESLFQQGPDRSDGRLACRGVPPQPTGEPPVATPLPPSATDSETLAGGALDEGWRQQVRELRGDDSLKSLAQALLVQEAAGRQDVAGVMGLLDEVDMWRRFHAGPPRFVLQALAATVAVGSIYPAGRRALGRWLQRWDRNTLVPVGAALATQAGLEVVGATAEPPQGVPAVPWLLHQAARAVGREDAVLALALVRRALAAADNDSAEVGAIHEALPELERRARAQALANAVAPMDPPPAALLVDAVDLLTDTPGGAAVLEATQRGDSDAACTALDTLLDQPDLPPRLAHHIALLGRRAAAALEGQGKEAEAEPHWRRAWRGWVRFLAAPPDAGDPPSDEARAALLEELLTTHRHQISHLLAREAMEPARRLWALVQQLPGLAPDGTLRDELSARAARFREELATEYLLATRETMRCGDIPEGWRADYEKGLAGLRRLLSLDRDNVRLLTALVEECTEWFFDLYQLGEPADLREQTERFTPFALQLARLAEGRPGDLAARAALADFFKFRGFVCRDRDQKVALYREALRFNPANDNVRQLLAELEPPEE